MEKNNDTDSISDSLQTLQLDGKKKDNVTTTKKREEQRKLIQNLSQKNLLVRKVHQGEVTAIKPGKGVYVKLSVPLTGSSPAQIAASRANSNTNNSSANNHSNPSTPPPKSHGGNHHANHSSTHFSSKAASSPVMNGKGNNVNHGNHYNNAKSSPPTNHDEPQFVFVDAVIPFSEIPAHQTVVIQRLPVGSKMNVYVSESSYSQKDWKVKARIGNHPHPIFAPFKFPSPDSLPPQQFRYFIIIDFEATCDYAPLPLVQKYESEIIEFPWVVYDTVKREVVHKERYLIRPRMLHGVTRYCTLLTGITQNDVKSGILIEQALLKFENYVKTGLGLAQGEKFIILTDGIWDLQVQLHNEATFKRVPLSSYFKQYLDLKLEFKFYFNYFSDEHRPSLRGMLKAFGLDLIGRHHSGIDDCQNIAQIVDILIKLGHVFSHWRLTEKEYSMETDPEYVDFCAHAPFNAWKCTPCQAWNPPILTRCKFCNESQSYAISACSNCGGPYQQMNPGTPEGARLTLCTMCSTHGRYQQSSSSSFHRQWIDDFTQNDLLRRNYQNAAGLPTTHGGTTNEHGLFIPPPQHQQQYYYNSNYSSPGGAIL